MPARESLTRTFDAKVSDRAKASPRNPLAGRVLGPAAQLEAIRGTIAHGPVAQATASAAPVAAVQEAPRRNRTGLPDGLKAGMEALSGLSMDDVRVHRNSAEPAKLGALAYAQGTAIHVAPGEERHLAHEAWHVVQQKQGRVQPNAQLSGQVPINDRADLEREADQMGARAATAGADGARVSSVSPPSSGTAAPVQRKVHVFNDGKKALDTSTRGEVEKVAGDIDTAVGNAVGLIRSDPAMTSQKSASGYLAPWVTTFNTWVKTGDMGAFFYARYGYAVEALATAEMGTKSYTLVAAQTQVTHGATRPDFVVAAKSSKKEVAWIDITSSGSQGHVLAKQHSGWTTLPYVAEILYDPPDLSAFSKSAKLSDDQRKLLLAISSIQETAVQDLQRGTDALAIVIDNALDTRLKAKGQGLSNTDIRKEVSDAVKAVLAPLDQQVSVEDAGEVLRCIPTVRVGDTEQTGAWWAQAFSTRGYQKGHKLLQGYGAWLRKPESSAAPEREDVEMTGTSEKKDEKSVPKK